MKTKIFLIVLYCLSIQAFCQSSSALQFGSNGFDAINDFEIGKNGDVFVTGYFQGKYGSYTSNGNFDVFIAKYDVNNNLIWFNQLGSNYYKNNHLAEYGKEIVLDEKENVYVSGYFRDSLELEKKKIKTQKKQGVFISKYNADGRLLWLKNINDKYDNLIDFKIFKNNLYVFADEISHNEDVGKKTYLTKIDHKGKIISEKEIYGELKSVHFGENFISLLMFEKKKSQGQNRLIRCDYNGKQLTNYDISNQTSKRNLISIKSDVNQNTKILYYNSGIPHGNSSTGLITINKKGELIEDLNFDIQMFFKPKDFVLTDNGYNIFGVFTNSIDKASDDATEGAVIFSYDMKSKQLKEKYFSSNENQTRITNVKLTSTDLTFSGYFFDTTKINQQEFSSNGRADSFVIREKLNASDYEDHISNNTTLVLYPNPTEGILNFSSIEGIKNIQLWDIAGRLILEQKIEKPNLDISKLESAEYILKIFLKSGEIKAKTILLKK